MGLTGPAGCCPGTTRSCSTAWRGSGPREIPEKHALRDWLDLFNHRFVSLFTGLGEVPVLFPLRASEDPLTEPDLFTACLSAWSDSARRPSEPASRLGPRAADDGESQERVLAGSRTWPCSGTAGCWRSRSVGGRRRCSRTTSRPRPGPPVPGPVAPIEPRNRCGYGTTATMDSRSSTVVGERGRTSSPRSGFDSAFDYHQFLEFLPDRRPFPCARPCIPRAPGQALVGLALIWIFSWCSRGTWSPVSARRRDGLRSQAWLEHLVAQIKSSIATPTTPCSRGGKSS